jgi:hypothetical protein
MDGTPPVVIAWPGRRRWFLAAVALLVVGTLVTFDCLNLLHSDSWSDLSRAPHLAAVSQGKASAGDPRVDHTAYPVSAVVPAAVALFAVWLLWGIATEQAPTRRAAGVRRRHAGRSPPARVVRLPARS